MDGPNLFEDALETFDNGRRRRIKLAQSSCDGRNCVGLEMDKPSKNRGSSLCLSIIGLDLLIIWQISVRMCQPCGRTGEVEPQGSIPMKFFVVELAEDGTAMLQGLDEIGVP